MHQKYTALINCSIIFGLFHAGRQMLPPTLPSIAQELSLNYTQAGLLLSSYDFGFGTTLLIAGILSDRFRKTFFIALSISAFTVATTVTPFTTGFNQLFSARILSGLSYGFYFAAGVSIIALYFTSHERGRAIGIHGIGNSSGKLFSPLIATLFLATLGWRPLFYFVSLPAAVMTFVFLKTVREPESAKKPSVKLTKELKDMLSNMRLLRISVASGLTIGITSAVASYLPLYLVDVLKQDKIMGASFLILYNIMAIIGNFSFSALSDRIGRRKASVAAFAAMTPLLLILPTLPFGAYLFIDVALIGALATSPFTILTVYVTEIGSQHSRGAFLGLFNTITTIGASLSTLLSGVASDAFGIASLFTIMAAVSLIGVLAVPKQPRIEIQHHA
ncbi:MAG: MFS transporter [Thaumarchaeota archaeon]|nr:MFS transporter [Nitrososphaerota archaeon]